MILIAFRCVKKTVVNQLTSTLLTLFFFLVLYGAIGVEEARKLLKEHLPECAFYLDEDDLDEDDFEEDDLDEDDLDEDDLDEEDLDEVNLDEDDLDEVNLDEDNLDEDEGEDDLVSCITIKRI
jgi:hypothetical protein